MVQVVQPDNKKSWRTKVSLSSNPVKRMVQCVVSEAACCTSTALSDVTFDPTPLLSTSAVGFLRAALALAQAHSGPLGTGKVVRQRHVQDLVVQRVAVCTGTDKGFKQQLKDKTVARAGACVCITSIVCGFEPLLSFGQEASVSPVQQRFDLLLRVVGVAGRKLLLRPDACHLQAKAGSARHCNIKTLFICIVSCLHNVHM